jgi:hypothetical protein
MNRRALLVSMTVFAVAGCSRQQEKAPASGAGMPDPAAIIAPLYQPYLAHAPLTALQDQAPWTARLHTQIAAMLARSATADEPILDFDPIIGAQDFELSNLTLSTEAVVENSHAVVRADFTNLGRAQTIVYDLAWEDSGWRVDNIRGAAWDLRQIASQGATP